MKLKNAVRYQAQDLFKATGVYYIVMVCIVVLTFILKGLISGSFTSGSTTFDGSSVIFIFVMGLNAFKNPFKMYQQNSISRKTQWTGFVLSAFVLAMVMMLVDSLYPLLLGDSLRYVSNYASLYEGFGRAGKVSFVGMMWTWMSYFAAISFGYFLTTLYYRMNKVLKVLVSAGVPLLLFVGLPMIELFVPSFNLLTSLLKFIAWAMGIDFTGGFVMVPWRAVGSFAVISVVCLGFAWLLMRRATLKDN